MEKGPVRNPLIKSAYMQVLTYRYVSDQSMPAIIKGVLT